jgi:predicted porin
MKKFSLGALVAAGLLVGGLSAGSASAADLGGNCCADLEERIAELEATTARKGNRKVSLTVSGWVAQQAMWWDDGTEQNVYIMDIGSTIASHFKFTGQATISPGWYAGYVLHIEAVSTNSLGVSQVTDDAGSGVSVLQSFWFIKSDHLGKLSVGRQSQASDNTAILVDGSGSLIPANWVAFDYFGFQFRDATGALTGLTWGNIGGCVGGGAIGDCNGGTQDVVRYDSPTFGGFSVSASWGEDDMWDVAARYAGEHAGFKVAIAAAYNELTDEVANGNLPSGLVPGDTFKYFQVGAYIEHVPTGVFVYGAYGYAEYDISTGDSETFYGKAGLRERWHPLGHTVLYGEYENNQASGAAFTQGLVGGSSDFDLWGVGVVQEIDAAAMSLWLSYRNLSYSETTLPGSVPDQDFQYVKAGALINF